MKRLVSLVYFFLFALFFQNLFAQSDYAIVQGFKDEHKEIEQHIKNAESLEELNVIVTKIKELKGEYTEHKELLDKSLYPDKFDKSIQKLNAAFVLRQNDFATIDVLQTEVVELEIQVDYLTERNNEIISKIDKLENLRRKDQKTIAELEEFIEDLRNSIMERDKLVLAMMDKLVPPIMREKATLSTEDKNIVRRLEKKDDVLENIKISMRDNMRFLEATSLNPVDIQTVQEQQEQFAKMWQVIGPRLVDVYAEKSKKAEELKEIDSLFVEWYHKSVDQNVWRSIRNEFRLNGVNLKEFNFGDEFAESVNLFIKDEIKNLGVKSSEASENTFTNFADSTWFTSIKPVWVPYLIEGGLLTEENKDEIEAGIEEWKSELYPSKWWLYLILWIAIIAILVPVILLIIKKRKPKEAIREENKE
ncbi:MAG: hypothetical protein KJO59_14520 [Ignavibacteria bacterium]|nr:hypothetical protein [Ignavibacteria bacterium]